MSGASIPEIRRAKNRGQSREWGEVFGAGAASSIITRWLLWNIAHFSRRHCGMEILVHFLHYLKYFTIAWLLHVSERQGG